MNEHQRRLWQRMIDSIDKYLNNETQDFFGIVGELEGTLFASDIKDKDLIVEWYDLWTPLEIRRAIEIEEGIKLDKDEAVKELVILKKFLMEHT